MFLVSPIRAQDFEEARNTFFSGDYGKCIELTRAQVDKGIWNDFWSRQLMRALIETGEYEEARDVYLALMEENKFTSSIDLRTLGASALRYCGQEEEGQKLLDEIPVLLTNAPWRYSDRENLLAVGKYLLAEGEDARYILESCYDRILKSDPTYVEAYVAIGELALTKADYQEAVNALSKALEKRPEDPNISFLLAQAWETSDKEKSDAFLKAALDLNSKHIPSLLFGVRKLIDAERYDAAEQGIEEVLAINASTPKAWGLRAALAHLRGDYNKEGEYRKKGLEKWNTNPEVDFIAGKTLSRHYRFQESVAYQRRALKLDPKFLPAKFQLGQDLLRVGLDEDGWSLVDEVAEEDKYNVVAFNLRKLHTRITKFTTLEAPGFIVRMEAKEAEIYGERVLALLSQAQDVLCKKYQFELERPTTVEIFPQQSDFAIRTFGLPGGAGYLGVCFGSLITANSPASQGSSPSNWESVLWHEFCHVITLQKTNNRMPRWLSEGISVYEELERDSSWGQSMSPLYKQMLLGEDFVPLSELSSAFMSPKSPIHLQFAYYESSLAVRYLVEKHGRPLLLKALEDLGMGVTLESAFSRRFGDAGVLDKDFKEYVQAITASFNPDTDFSKGDFAESAGLEEIQAWVDKNPNSYAGQALLAQAHVQNENWGRAKESVVKLLELYPDDTSANGGLKLAAYIAKKTGDAPAERAALEKIMKHSSNDVAALLRLTELCQASEDWEALATYSGKLLAVNPLIPNGHEGLVAASSALQEPLQAIQPLQALQGMNPLDPAGLHFQLSSALLNASSGEHDRTEEARIEALLALEHSPRYREAQQLLKQLVAIRNGEAKLPSEFKTAVGELDTPNQLLVEPPANGSPPSPRKAS
ncbi:MAG: tetratricopeptide repeat protein [Planctomycetota bacterium]